MKYRLMLLYTVMFLSMMLASCGIKADHPMQLPSTQPSASTVSKEPSAEPSLPDDDADTSCEPGAVVPKEEIKSYEHHVMSADVPEAEGLKDTLPAQNIETYDLSGLISGTDLDGLTLSECIQYAQGDIVLFLNSRGKRIVKVENDIAVQLRQTKEGSQYIFIGCIQLADYYVVVLSNDETRGEEIRTLYYNILVGMY